MTDQRPQSIATVIASNDKTKLLTLTFFFVLVGLLWIQNKPTTPLNPFSLQALRQLHIAHGSPAPIKQTMTVQQAYATTGVVFTPFRPETTKMPREEAAYIKELFDLTNIGVIERVEMMFDNNKLAMRKSVVRNHAEILRRIDALKFPSKLEQVHLLILNAVYEEKLYFDELVSHPGKRFNPSDTLVQTSDLKLRAAYNLLMEMYAEEGEVTKRSFYSQLCALSFV